MDRIRNDIGLLTYPMQADPGTDMCVLKVYNKVNDPDAEYAYGDHIRL